MKKSPEYGPRTVTELKNALNDNPDSAALMYNLGVSLVAERNLAEAEKAFLEVIALEPGIAEAYVQLGGLAMNKGDLDACLAMNKKAAEVRPRFAVPWGNIGFVYMQQQDATKALKALKKAIGLDPQFIQAHTTLGSAYLALGDPDGCIMQCSKAIEIEPMFGPAYNNIGLAYLEKGEGDRAKTFFDKATETGFEVDPHVLEELAKLG